MADSLLESYETVTYLSRAIPLTDPDSIAANAILHGITPPPPDRCRVLELGCAAGMNLIAAAFVSPKCRFVGVDLAPSQIDVGRMIVSEMALNNVELHAASIDALDERLGQFDYIICHGVYSWVPAHVQDAILRVCAHHLAPNGIAYVSYNTFPGWHRRGMLRDMLLFHDDRSLPPGERIARSRDFAAFLAAADADNKSLHLMTLRDEVKQLDAQNDHHLFHEQLEPYNEPLYFSQFMDRASSHGLHFLCEAKPSSETASVQKLRETLGTSVDRVRAEQYADFIVGRTFRRTLLTRAANAHTAMPQASGVMRLYLRSRATQVAPSDEDARNVPGVESFRTPNDVTITTNNPVVLAMFHVLSDAAPGVVAFADLHGAVMARLRTSPDDAVHTAADDPEVLANAALQCAGVNLVEFRSLPSKFAARPSIRPKASALARWQAIHGDLVPSLGHWSVTLSGMERFLLQHLDGTNDRGQLVRLVDGALRTGELTVAGTPSREDLARVVDDCLMNLCHSALLAS
jgi:SAM-dependent methyltransferase/methyltransferase-like protein